MKKTLLLLAALAMAGSAFAQGTITFSNFGITVNRPDNTTGAGDGYTAGLFTVVGAGTPGAVYTALSPTGTFFSGTGILQPPDTDVIVTGHGVNSTDSVFVIRAWTTGSTFANAPIRGESATFTAGPLGGSNGANPPTLSPSIENATSFNMVNNVPEPTTIALGALGVGALLLRRRK